MFRFSVNLQKTIQFLALLFWALKRDAFLHVVVLGASWSVGCYKNIHCPNPVTVWVRGGSICQKLKISLKACPILPNVLLFLWGWNQMIMQDLNRVSLVRKVVWRIHSEKKLHFCTCRKLLCFTFALYAVRFCWFGKEYGAYSFLAIFLYSIIFAVTYADGC